MNKISRDERRNRDISFKLYKEQLNFKRFGLKRIKWLIIFNFPKKRLKNSREKIEIKFRESSYWIINKRKRKVNNFSIKF
jgi:hypothetical protein